MKVMLSVKIAGILMMLPFSSRKEIGFVVMIVGLSGAKLTHE